MDLERKFRWQLCSIQTRLLTPLAWLLSKRVPVATDFGRFGGDEIDPLTPEQHTAVAQAEQIAGG